MAQGGRSGRDPYRREAVEEIAPDRPAPGKVTSTARVANPERMSYAVSPGKRTLTMSLPPGSGAPLPDADTWSSRMGADVSAARVATGGAAADAAAELGARAFTVGKTIYFGAGAWDPSSADGQHLLAHELAHTLQQSGEVPSGGELPASQPGDATEREAHRAADAVIAGQRPPPLSAGPPMVAGDWFPFSRAGGVIVGPGGPVPVGPIGPRPKTNAGEYLERHGKKHGEELPPHMEKVSFALPTTYAAWKGGDSSSFARAVGEELMQKITAGKAEEVLKPAVAPANLWEIVNTAREDDAPDHPEQADEYHLRVTLDIVNALRERVRESLARMVPRYVNEWNRRTIEDRERRSTAGARSAPENPEANVPDPAAIRQSHPIDATVLEALSGPASGKLVANFPAYRRDFPAEAKVTERREPKPIKAFTWCNQQGAANWIRVTDPADATVEDVAREMYGEDTMAWKITPAAPLFGLEPMGLKPDHYRALSANGGGTSSDRPGGGPQTLPQQLLTGPLADEAALNQAKGFAPGPADAGALTQQFDQIVVHFGDLQKKVGPIGEETDKLEGARQRVAERKKRITGGNPGEIQSWSGQAREQLDVLVKCIEGVDRGDRVYASVKDQPQGQFEARLLRDKIARRYSRAASISDMVVTARGMMGEAERATQTFVVDWLDDIFRWLRGAIINSRSNRRTGGAQDPSLAVPDLDRRETEIRLELQQLRELLLTNPEAAQPRIQAVYQKLNDLSLEVALVRNIDACDEAWSNLKGGASTMGWIRGLAPGDHGNERLENLQGEANEFDAAWKKMLEDWRAGKRKEATDALEALSKSEKWKTFFDRVAREIRDQAEYDRLMIFLAMIGIAVVSAGAGLLAAGAVGGGVLGFAVGLTTEVTVFTSLSWALIDKEHTLSGFWSQWKQNFGIFLVLRGISGAFKLAGAAGGLAEVATQYAAINGIALYEANQKKVKEGKGALSAGEILETSLENLMFLVGVSIAGTLVQPWMSKLALRGEVGRRIGEVESLNQRVTELAKRVESTKGKDRAAAQQLLDRQAELLEKQGKVLEDLIRYADNPGAARDAGISEAQLKKIQEQRGKLDDSRRQIALTRLFASLEPVSAGSYLIARDGSIVRARADFEAQIGHDPEGARPDEGLKSVGEITTDSQTQSRSFTVEMKDGSSFRITERLGDGRMEKGSRPATPGAADAAPLGSECFVAGTLVATPGGPIAIEAVRPGQEVLTRDLAAGRVVTATVLGCMASEAERLLEVEVAGEVIRCTAGHPFWTARGGWATASDLSAGTLLLTAGGAEVPVAAIRPVAGGATVYNMEVGGLHTYLVSAAQVLVHNKAMRWMLIDRAAALRPRAEALLAQVKALPPDAPGRADLVREAESLQGEARDLTQKAEARGATEEAIKPHEARISGIEENLVRLEEAADVASLPGRSFDLPQRIHDLQAEIESLPDSEPAKWDLRQRATDLGEEAQTVRELMKDAKDPADLQHEVESVERRLRDLEGEVRERSPASPDEGSTLPRPNERYPRNHLPTGGTHPYEPPAHAAPDAVVPHPEGNGFVDRHGNRWEWARDQHAGPHWDVQHPNGMHTNVYPDGMVHQGADNFGRR